MSNSTTKKIINPQTGRQTIVDLAGHRFGKLVVMGLDHVAVSSRSSGRHNHRPYWLCRCDCGKNHVARSDTLTSGDAISCGCAKRGPAIVDLVGQRFGKLVVTSLGRGTGKGAYWQCECDCGRRSVVMAGDLNRGSSTSCGCNLLGENHHNWNPERGQLEDRVEAGAWIGYWRKAIYERDGYACQSCGDATSGNLNAHHLDSWSAYPERRVYLDNGITLCVDCHKEFHAWMGGTHTPCTEQDFVDWLCDPALE